MHAQPLKMARDVPVHLVPYIVYAGSDNVTALKCPDHYKYKPSDVIFANNLSVLIFVKHLIRG